MFRNPAAVEDGLGRVINLGEQVFSHTKPGETCTVYVNEVPTIHCFHTSCGERVEEANRRLRGRVHALESATPNAQGDILQAGQQSVEEPEQAAKARHQKKAEKDHNQKLLMLARANLPKIYATYPMGPDECYDRSPIHLPENQEWEDWRLLLGVLPREDRVWIGERYETGNPEHVKRFREVSTWLAQEEFCPGPLICPANFKPGTFSRAGASVVDTNFVIVESDTLTKEQVSSVFRWLQESWHLVAIVDSGNKSLHGWFQRPLCVSTEVWSKNKVVLEGLGCDTAMLRPSQPCRLPGCRRNGTLGWQHLRYLDHMESL